MKCGHSFLIIMATGLLVAGSPATAEQTANGTSGNSLLKPLDFAFEQVSLVQVLDYLQEKTPEVNIVMAPELQKQAADMKVTMTVRNTTVPVLLSMMQYFWPNVESILLWGGQTIHLTRDNGVAKMVQAMQNADQSMLAKTGNPVIVVRYRDASGTHDDAAEIAAPDLPTPSEMRASIKALGDTAALSNALGDNPQARELLENLLESAISKSRLTDAPELLQALKAGGLTAGDGDLAVQTFTTSTAVSMAVFNLAEATKAYAAKHGLDPKTTEDVAEQIASALDAAWKLADCEPGKLTYHKDTYLLMCSGSPEAMNIAKKVVTSVINDITSSAKNAD